MMIHVLLKSTGKAGECTFHGVTSLEDAANVWFNAGKEHWAYAIGDENEDPEFVQEEPITQD